MIKATKAVSKSILGATSSYFGDSLKFLFSSNNPFANILNIGSILIVEVAEEVNLEVEDLYLFLKAEVLQKAKL